MKTLDWEKEFDENVNYDEAELGCNWSPKDIKNFIKKNFVKKPKTAIDLEELLQSLE